MYELDPILKHATPSSMKVTKVVTTLEQALYERDHALQSLQSKYTAMELLMKSLANDLVNHEELYKSSQLQVVQLKRMISELSHQNNQYHFQLAMDASLSMRAPKDVSLCTRAP